MNLSRNFNLNEFVRSQTASRKGIDNTPNIKCLVQLVYLANTMQIIRDLFNQPIQITSGYRCDALNKAIGSIDTSDHKDGRAADFVVSGVSNKAVFNAIKASNINYSKLILEFPKSESGGWIHLSIHPYSENGRKIDLIATKSGGNTIYKNVT